MVDSESNRILRLLAGQWDNALTELLRLNSAAEARPADAQALFRPAHSSHEDIVRFEFGPVVFNLPERAYNLAVDLFAVVQGRLGFDRNVFRETETLVTHDFATEVGYFRHRPGALVHVFGAHYDLANDELGHPVFHAQLKPFPRFGQLISDHYRISAVTRDSMQGLLKTVRIPSAQMDIFSLVVQLCADHLLYEKSGQQEKDAFNALLKNNTFCLGAAKRFPRLTNDVARRCYRALHWYPVVV
jgi:hypothetical protein